ncbi:hypothetical protein HBI57_252610 [Parastagonospora nodorum]|nr:hypothetical protein HBH75_240390 [Parastagonospora nodorum]KAH6443615.1 hypothetical protein HBI57_252610 [Parastagonospora nodorum]
MLSTAAMLMRRPSLRGMLKQQLPRKSLYQSIVRYYKQLYDFRLERRVICSSFDSYLTVLGLDPPFRFLHHYPFHDMWNKPTCM